MVSAEEENFELVMMDEYPVLFTCARVDRSSVPENLYCYEVRHDDCCQGIVCEVKPHVAVNHWGTILSKTEIPLETGSYYPKEDFNYLGNAMSLKGYQDMDTKQLVGQEAAGGTEPIQGM